MNRSDIYDTYADKERHNGLRAAAERRLYALPTLRKKLEDDTEYLAQLQTVGAPERSRCIVRNSRGGRRLDKDEILEALINDIKSKIEADRHEIRTMEDALCEIDSDEYYPVIDCKYFRRMKDADIAEMLFCDPTTVWRNRKRLLDRLIVRLYGAAGI